MGSHFQKFFYRNVCVHYGDSCPLPIHHGYFLGVACNAGMMLSNFIFRVCSLAELVTSCLLLAWACSGQVDSNMRLMGSLLEPEVTGLVKLSHGEAYLSQEKSLEKVPSPSPSTSSSNSSRDSYSLMAAAGNIARKQTSEMLPLPDKLIRKISGETRFILKLYILGLRISSNVKAWLYLR